MTGEHETLSAVFNYITVYGHTERAFFKNPKLLGLGRQIGLKFFEAFGVFSAKLSALFWQCESLVRGKMYVLGCCSYKKLWFSVLKHITPKYDIGRKEFRK